MREHFTKGRGDQGTGGDGVGGDATFGEGPEADTPRIGARVPLTERQREVLTFIARSIEERGYPPTLREIGTRLGIRSTNGVNDHLKALEKKGYLQREDLKSRALRCVGPDGEVVGTGAVRAPTPIRPEVPSGSLGAALPLTGEMVAIPLVGRVAAGPPSLALEHVEDTVHVDRFFLGRAFRSGSGSKLGAGQGTGAEAALFALRVKGDSMIEDGIFDGDFIFVKKQLDPQKGEIVVVMIDDEATCKRYYPEGDTIRFQPANRTMQPILVRKKDFRSVNIIGVVIGVYRQI